MQTEREQAIAWLRDAILREDTPAAVREALRRQLQLYRQLADDEFDEVPPVESDEAEATNS